jgi:cytochrome c biogenesis protein CcmG, thiol:disulfide interchange protein DsbE
MISKLWRFSMRSLTCRLGIASAVIIALLGLSAPSRAAAPVNVGDAAPDFALPDLNGRQMHLADLRGKVVLLNFWGTFCGPCRKEMPALENLHASMKSEGFTVLAVSIDRSEDTVKAFLAQTPSSFPVLMDREKAVYRGPYATFALPLTYLIDKHGTIVAKYLGSQEWDSAEFKERVRGLARE